MVTTLLRSVRFGPPPVAGLVTLNTSSSTVFVRMDKTNGREGLAARRSSQYFKTFPRCLLSRSSLCRRMGMERIPPAMRTGAQYEFVTHAVQPNMMTTPTY